MRRQRWPSTFGKLTINSFVSRSNYEKSIHFYDGISDVISDPQEWCVRVTCDRFDQQEQGDVDTFYKPLEIACVAHVFPPGTTDLYRTSWSITRMAKNVFTYSFS